MPFKLRLKKAGKYSVSTKNAFLVTVNLLDNSRKDFTLNEESTGQECLLHIAQKLDITEVGVRCKPPANTSLQICKSRKKW